MNNKFMLDTNIFDRLIEGKVNKDILLSKGELFITHVQRDEIKAMPESKREKREALLNSVKLISPNEARTAWVLGVTPLGYLSEGEHISRIISYLKNRGDRKNTLNDAIIGNACITLGITLITDDRLFSESMKSLGAHVINYRDLNSSSV